MISKKYVFPLIVSLFSTSAMAQDHYDDDDDHDGAEFMLGVMGMSDRSIYVGGKDQTQVVPFLQIEWGRFYLQGPSMGVTLLEQGNTTLSASIDLDGLFDEDRDESPQLKDMTGLDNVLMASLNYGYESDWGELEVSVGADVSGGHDGYKAELSYGYPIHMAGWMVTPEVSVEWASEEINQYYYGVSAVDVTESRPLYTPGAGVNYEIGVTAMYPFMDNHAVMLRAGYEVYSKEVTDSPIVDEDNAMSFGIGYVYRF